MINFQDLLTGFVDTHIHAGPGLMPREFDSWELAAHAAKNNFTAVVIKDHHLPSMGLARIIQDHFPDGTIRVFGSIALNSTVGGINPQALETAIRFGAKIVWLPTISARHHHKTHAAAGFPKPIHPPRIEDTPIDCLDSNRRLIPALETALSVMAEAPDVVLATGHISPMEVDAVVRRAEELGIRRIIITHPLFMVDAEMDEMKKWVKQGAYLEFTAINSFPESRIYTLPPAKIAAVIKTVGADRVILSSDAGLKGNGRPFENVMKVLELLHDEGIADNDLRKLVVDNPAQVMGL
jgi:hypothetical protein